MIRVSTISALFAIAVIAFASGSATGAQAKRSDLFGCAGMELAQNAEPKEDAPEANPDPDSGDGSNGANSQSPDDNNDNEDDGGAGSGMDQASPPDTAQPPGCIFRNEPLDLLV